MTALRLLAIDAAILGSVIVVHLTASAIGAALSIAKRTHAR